MIREGISSEELYGEFIDKVEKVMARLKEKHDELKKMKESDRTKSFWTNKIINEWYDNRGRTK